MSPFVGLKLLPLSGDQKHGRGARARTGEGDDIYSDQTLEDLVQEQKVLSELKFRYRKRPGKLTCTLKNKDVATMHNEKMTSSLPQSIESGGETKATDINIPDPVWECPVPRQLLRPTIHQLSTPYCQFADYFARNVAAIGAIHFGEYVAHKHNKAQCERSSSKQGSDQPPHISQVAQGSSKSLEVQSCGRRLSVGAPENDGAEPYSKPTEQQPSKSDTIILEHQPLSQLFNLNEWSSIEKGPKIAGVNSSEPNHSEGAPLLNQRFCRACNSSSQASHSLLEAHKIHQSLSQRFISTFVSRNRSISTPSCICKQSLGVICDTSPDTSLACEQSSCCLLDCRRKTEWDENPIRVLKPCEIKLGDIKVPIKSIGMVFWDDRCLSKHVPPLTLTCESSRKLTEFALHNAKTGEVFFKGTIANLEEFLNETITIACHAIEYSLSPGMAGCGRSSPGPYLCPRKSLCHNEDIDISHIEIHRNTVFEFHGQSHLIASLPSKHAALSSSSFKHHRPADIMRRLSVKRENTQIQNLVYRKRKRPTSFHHVIQFLDPDTKRLADKKSQDGDLETKTLTSSNEMLQTHQRKAPNNYSMGKLWLIMRGWLIGNFPMERPIESQSSQSNLDATRGDTVLEDENADQGMHSERAISLRRRSHVSLRNIQGFNLPKSRKHQPIARDWSPIRKTLVAAVACISTALIGILLGVYSGLVPSIQYYIVDQSHVAIHGNTGCFLGLALPTFFLWPLSLLHGRKPYIMSGLVLTMALLFPQAIAVNSIRLTKTAWWRALLIVSRTLMGFSLGFGSMNFHSILTDLFGVSMMSTKPHQEVVDQLDARRHGGGMGAWLGIWTWCWVSSLGIGFLIGALIIDHHPPAWGFYFSIMLTAVILLLNVACPETRRSAYRRSVAEVQTDREVSRRLARGEIMMHRVKTGPLWWGEEVYHGVLLSIEMLRQPGFAVLAVYVAWIYAQMVLTIILLGSLVSRLYLLRSSYVGLHVAAITLGACLAIPFQKASIFSRSRSSQVNSSRQTLDRKMTWSSHLIRRAVFTSALPVAAIFYAAFSSGPSVSIAFPTVFAMCIGFLSCLAISECNGLVMETFDTSDISPGMVDRQRDLSDQNPKTNYSSFPRVSSGLAIIHSLAFIFAACSTAVGGHMTRTLGQRVASGVVAGILLILTVFLLLVLIRFKNILIIPRSKSAEMDRLTQARRKSTQRRISMPHNAQALIEEDAAWRPVMMGNPMGKFRRMNILELGYMSRWQDIRRKNKLVDEGAHLDATLENDLEDLHQTHEAFSMGSTRRQDENEVREGPSNH